MLSAVDVPESGILHQEQSCKLNVNRHNHGNGCLYISEENLIWENEEHRGLTLRYKDVAIHAISTDLQAFPEECLYIMYNGELNCNGNTISNGDSQETDESDGNDYGTQYSSNIIEIRFIPQSKDRLTTMFNAMADGQCLHPDSEDSDDYYDGTEEQATDNTGVGYNPTFEDGGGEGFYTSEEGLQHLTPQGEATLQRLENMLAQSEISRPNHGRGEMAGVIVSDDAGEPDSSDLPYVGRDIDEQMEGSNVNPIEGQFDDVDGD